MAGAAACLAYYLLVTSGFSADLFRPTDFGMTFNSMLQRMLDGAFDIDPDLIRYEGFRRDGKVYAYFGIFSALLRLPLVPARLLMEVDITRVSCALALAVAAYGKLHVLGTLRAAAGPIAPATDRAILLVAVAMLFGGSQIQFLNPSMYQEAVSWALAFGMLFVAVLAGGLIRGQAFGTTSLALLAVLGGLAFLARASIGLSLCVALAAVLLVKFFLPALVAPDRLRALLSPRLVVPGLVLAVFAMVVLYVNYRRWGNALEFMPFRSYVAFEKLLPDRMAQQETYGAYNLVRVPFNLQYYLLPVWGFTVGGKLIFADWQATHMLVVQLPPSTPLLSDPVPVAFAAVAGLMAWRGTLWRVVDKASVLPAVPGLSAGFMLVLLFSTAAPRYRAEYGPLLELLALLGLHCLVQTGHRFTPRQLWLMAAGVAVGFVVAHLVLASLYFTSWGPAEMREYSHGMIRYFYWGYSVFLGQMLGL